MSERRWRVTGLGSGQFAIEVDDGGGFRAATAAEVDAALRHFGWSNGGARTTICWPASAAGQQTGP